MIPRDIDYDAILWPHPYRRHALNRASLLETSHKTLAYLYRQVFTPEPLRLPAIPLDIPFAHSVPDQQQAERYYDAVPDLPLSIVVVSRNDTHVERMEDRTRACIDCIYHLARTYERKVELIVVEWNPPFDRPPLAVAFDFPDQDPWVSSHIVTVPRSLHREYGMATELPLYQMIGKNVGIRRARGRFILSTNIDILLSGELFSHITGPGLESGRIYRANRWDVARGILDLVSPEAMLEKARDLCFQINYPHAAVAIEDSVPEFEPMRDYAGSTLFPALHTMACGGDFQLLHRDDWARLRGFGELDAYCFHLDSLLMVSCHHAGIGEVDFGNTLLHYHIDHTLGTAVSGDTYAVDGSKGLKHISMAGLGNASRNMETEGAHFIFNKSNWGLAGIDLPFHNATRAGWESSRYRPERFLEDGSKGGLGGVNLDNFNIDQLRAYQDQKKAVLTRITAATAAYLATVDPARPIWICGTGRKGTVFRELLRREGVSIEKLVTSEELTRSMPRLVRRPYILILSMYADLIIEELNACQLKEGRDFLVGF